MTKKQLGKKLKKIRKEKDISQADLAYMCGMNNMSIYHLEKGNRKVDVSEAVKLGSVLDLSIDFFYTED